MRLYCSKQLETTLHQFCDYTLAGLYLSNFIRGVEVLAIEVCAHCQCTVHCSIQYTL